MNSSGLIGPLKIGMLVIYCLRYLPGLIALGFVTHFGFPLCSQFLAEFLGHSLGQAIALFFTIGVSGVIYFAVGHFLGVRESLKVTRRFLKR